MGLNFWGGCPPQTAKHPSRLRGQKTTIQNRECLVTKNHCSKNNFQEIFLDNPCIFWGFPKNQFGVNRSIIRVPNRRKPSFFTLFLVFVGKRRYLTKKILAHAIFFFELFFSTFVENHPRFPFHVESTKKNEKRDS